MNRILISVESPFFIPWDKFSAVACVVRSFAETLHNNGYEVYINEYSYKSILANGQSIKGAATKKKQIPKWYRFFSKRIREGFKDILLIRQLARQFEVVSKIPRPDIIISWVSYGSANGFYLSKAWDVPLISIYDNPLCEEYKFQFGFNPFLFGKVERSEKLMLGNSKKVIVYSEEMAFHLKKKYDFPVNFSYNQFIDTSKINYLDVNKKKDPLQLVFIGSFLKWHRIESLLNVFEKLHAKHQSIKLILIGDGPEKKNIEQLVSGLVCRNNVEFKGLMGKDELFDVLQQSHIGIIPYALWFHAPVKLFQYAAAGLAIVAYQTPTIDFIVKGYESSFALFNSDEQMLNQLEKIIDDQENLILKMANQSQRLIKDKYNVSSYLSFFEETFQEIEQTNA
jgi:glycosyltransferase involved in cell wall biosynthesis